MNKVFANESLKSNAKFTKWGEIDQEKWAKDRARENMLGSENRKKKGSKRMQEQEKTRGKVILGGEETIPEDRIGEVRIHKDIMGEDKMGESRIG